MSLLSCILKNCIDQSGNALHDGDYEDSSDCEVISEVDQQQQQQQQEQQQQDIQEKRILERLQKRVVIANEQEPVRGLLMREEMQEVSADHSLARCEASSLAGTNGTTETLPTATQGLLNDVSNDDRSSHTSTLVERSVAGEGEAQETLGFWRRLFHFGSSKEQSSNNDSVKRTTHEPLSSAVVTDDKDYTASPLRLANSYTSGGGADSIPAINLDEFVMPGSKLQKAMSEALRRENDCKCVTEIDYEDECVICFEGFDIDNPRMPTLCGCGENKTYFHLPCLLQWTDKHLECPACRQKITWQEFN